MGRNFQSTLLMGAALLFSAFRKQLRVRFEFLIALATPFQLRRWISMVSGTMPSPVFLTVGEFGSPLKVSSASKARDLAKSIDFLIVLSQRMAVLAVQFLTTRPAHILFMGDRLKMIGVDAASLPAFVIQFHSQGHLSLKGQVRKHMGKLDMLHAMSLPIADAVTTMIQAADPDPATSVRLRDAMLNDRFRGALSLKLVGQRVVCMRPGNWGNMLFVPSVPVPTAG